MNDNEWQPSLVQSIRAKDPNDWTVRMPGLCGWHLVDVTYDPHNKEWMYTYRITL